MSYDKTRFINNVYFLARQRRIKIRDLESGCGVSLGYFARLRQGKKDAAPGADCLLSVAELLTVSVDALLTFDFPQASEAEDALHRYMEKLIRDTRSHRLVWMEDISGYANTVPISPDGTTPHPLFMTLPLESGVESHPYYFSRFHPDCYTLIPLKTYGCVLSEGKTLYMVQVCDAERNPNNPDDWTELELLLTGPGKYESLPFCHTNHERASRLDEDMKRLFDTVSDAVTLPHLSAEARTYIEDFLAEREESDEK